MPARAASAFAPAAISNFFTINYKEGTPASRLAASGATGGGFMLSAGVETTATALGGPGPEEIRVKVNGDSHYRARTTITALRILLNDPHPSFSRLKIDQRVQVPIGQGFGASAASALSAVIAGASALGMSVSRERVALAAHAADILCRTGLGTVGAIYDGVGAGAVTKPGGPGVCEFLQIPVPQNVTIVTASLGPYRKSKILSSAKRRRFVNRLGKASLASVRRDPTLETLAVAGERFAERLGLETPELRSLVTESKESGALWSSQNMVGYAVHSLVPRELTVDVVRGLKRSRLRPLVHSFEFGARSAVLVS